MKKALLCFCTERKLVDAQKMSELASSLKGAGCEVLAVSDLCGACVNEAEKIREFANGAAVFACNKRAVSSLLNFAGASDFAEIFDVKNAGKSEVFSRFISGENTGEFPIEKSLGKWIAWYPVIDKSRCVDCGKCVDFCVFGVYKKIGKIVSVENPQSCKNNCPACARVCPKQAIIFPKCKDSKICGDIPIEENSEQNSSQKKGDFYDALKARSASRKKFFKQDERQE